mmetsp:Transcript_30809/g.87144  ORF Transcript_30809/g.87144 Transcript_30809/m.87144 type:complete len:253 (+) Transcript_30809:1719-2477(+)
MDHAGARGQEGRVIFIHEVGEGAVLGGNGQLCQKHVLPVALLVKKLSLLARTETILPRRHACHAVVALAAAELAAAIGRAGRPIAVGPAAGFGDARVLGASGDVGSKRAPGGPLHNHCMPRVRQLCDLIVLNIPAAGRLGVGSRGIKSTLPARNPARQLLCKLFSQVEILVRAEQINAQTEGRRRGPRPCKALGILCKHLLEVVIITHGYEGVWVKLLPWDLVLDRNGVLHLLTQPEDKLGVAGARVDALKI